MGNSSLRSLGKYKNPFTKVLMAIIAVLVMVPYEFAEYLSGKTYKGLAGIFRGFLGFGLGIAGGITAAHYVGWTLGANTVLWLLSGLGGFVATTFYLFPILHLIVLRPAWNLAEWIWDGIRDFARAHFETLTAGFVRLLNRGLPGSGKPWGIVLDSKRDSWVSKVLTAVAYPTSVAASGWLGWSVYKALSAFSAAAWGVPALVATVVGAFVGFVLAALAVGILAQLLKYGKQPYLAMATGALLTYGLAGLTTGFVTTTLGLSAPFVYAAYALEFILYTAYVFPSANIVLTDGFRLFVEHVWPKIEKVYDGEEKSYRQFFHSVVNLAVAWKLASLSLLLAPMLALPVWAGYAIAALVAVLSYLLVFKMLDMDGGNVIIAILLSLATGWLSGSAYASAGLLFGTFGAIAVGIVSAFAMGFLAFPLVYIGARAVAKPLLASWLSQPLVKVHAWCWEGFKKIMKEVGHCYEYGYRDKTPYKEFFLHVVNLAATIGAGFGSVAAAHWLGFAPWLTVAATIVLTALSYLLVGKLILKVGTEVPGTVASLSAAIYVGATVYAAQPTWWLAGLVGLAALLVTFFLAFPLAYVIVRLLAKPLLSSWLRGVLVAIYDWCWARFVDLWEQFLSIYRAIRDFLKPYWAKVVDTWRSIRKAIKDAYDSLRGRKTA